MRLDKYLSNSGLCSRRDAAVLLRHGSVELNGRIIRDGSVHITPESDCVAVDGEVIGYQSLVYYMMNKPSGAVCATEDREQTVLDLMTERERRRGVFPVGRLDRDTTGLLLLTNDGGFSHSVTSPKKRVSKRYRASLDAPICQNDIESFKSGITLADGTKCLPAGLEPLDGAACLVSLQEGKYHQVKRMLAACGRKVLALERLSIGGLSLDPALAPGEWRLLTIDEKEAVFLTVNSTL